MAIKYACAVLLAGCGGTAAITPPRSAIAVPDKPTVMLAASESSHVVELAPGAHHTCVRFGDGHVECFGEGRHGALGDGTTDTRPTPGRATIDHVTNLCSGDMYSCARTEDGTVHCWGANNSGQLGDGSTEMRSTPVAVADLTDAIDVACGDVHVCAQTKTGVRCWGENDHGSIGGSAAGPTPRAMAPLKGLEGIVTLSLGGAHSCALMRDGSVRCWGTNAHGQLGDGTTNESSTPKTVIDLPPVIQVASGDRSTCARTPAGVVWCWGGNPRGQLGMEGDDQTKPHVVAALPPVDQISSGDMHVCGHTRDGKIFCWGSNNGGQLGGQDQDRSQPKAVPDLDGALDVTAGWAHTCARKPNDVLVCWGHNQQGQLGDGTTKRRFLPTPVLFQPTASNSTSKTSVD